MSYFKRRSNIFDFATERSQTTPSQNRNKFRKPEGIVFKTRLDKARAIYACMST